MAKRCAQQPQRLSKANTRDAIEYIFEGDLRSDEDSSKNGTNAVESSKGDDHRRVGGVLIG